MENRRWEKCEGCEKRYLDVAQWGKVWEKCYLDDARGGSEMSGAGTDFPTELHNESASG